METTASQNKGAGVCGAGENCFERGQWRDMIRRLKYQFSYWKLEDDYEDDEGHKQRHTHFENTNRKNYGL